MGVLPKKREPNPKRVYFLFREDIRYMQNIARETRLLVTHRIDTAEQLAAHKDGLAAQSKTLCTNRKRLRHQARSIQDEEKLAAVKSEIAALSMKIGELRREVKLCEESSHSLPKGRRCRPSRSSPERSNRKAALSSKAPHRQPLCPSLSQRAEANPQGIFRVSRP